MSFLYKSLKYNLIKNKIKKNNPFFMDNNQKTKIFLFFVACGRNMGDHAIVEAEKYFIRETLGSDFSIVEIPVNQCENAIDSIKDIITEKDIIVLSAGGYLGDEYIEVYYPLLRILNIYKNNKIVIFPQTVFFHSIHREIAFCKKIRKCSNLKIFVREEKSREIFDRNEIHAKLVPDIVLSEKIKEDCQERSQEVLLCLRNDVERGIGDYQCSIIKEMASCFGEVVQTDTVVTKSFPIAERRSVLEEVLSKFSSSKLVITDRIHGMIFAYLTLTPCIVIGNYNHKVESEYNWLKECDFISFVKNIKKEELLSEIDKVLKAHRKPIENFESNYLILKESLRNMYE